MKLRAIAAVAALVAVSASGQDKTASEDKYTEVDFKQLLVAPESYRSKFVSYSAQYRNFSTTFPPYMEQSGVNASKYFLLEIGDLRLPAILKKSDSTNALVAATKPWSIVRVKGKVKEFRVDPRITMLPRYYVEVHSFSVEKGPEEAFQKGEGRQGGIDRKGFMWGRRHRKWKEGNEGQPAQEPAAPPPEDDAWRSFTNAPLPRGDKL